MTGNGGVPPISVVLASREPWPALERALELLHPQAVDLGAELIVPIADPRCQPPDAPERFPAVRWLLEPGATIVELRARAFTASTAQVVAITEDHATVESGWLRGHLDAHAAHPHAVAVGGVVLNATTATRLDRANFFVASGRFLPPLEAGESPQISLQANSSMKRRALPATWPEQGYLAMTFLEELRDRGERFVADPRLVVRHYQHLDAATCGEVHFHNGRAIAGFRSLRMSAPQRALRAVACAVLPAVMLWRTLRDVTAKHGQRRAVLSSSGWIVWLLLWHAAGEAAGYLLGPGESAGKLP